MRFPVVAAVLACCAVSLSAQDTRGVRLTMALPDPLNSCGTWVTNRKATKKGTGESAAVKVIQVIGMNRQNDWISGFVSGASVFGGVPVGETTAASTYLWIDNYCEKNPLDSLVDAAKAFAAGLLKRDP